MTSLVRELQKGADSLDHLAARVEMEGQQSRHMMISSAVILALAVAIAVFAAWYEALLGKH
jgi:hypothetical protein